MPRIRDILDRHDDIWRHVGDLSALTESAWVAVLAADNPLAVESIKRTAAEMKAELAGENPTRLRQMLADQVVISWLEFTALENASADAGAVLNQSRFQLKRLESAQRRHLAAIKALTELQKLLPPVQVAEKPLTLFDPKPKSKRA